MTTEQATSTSWLKTLLIIVVVLLGIAYLFRLLTPQQVVVQPLLNTNYTGNKTTFKNVIFSGNVPLVPDKFPIAKAEGLQIETDALEKKLIEYFKVQRFPEVENLWIGTKYSLTKIPAENLYIVTAETQPPKSFIGDSQKAINQAQAIVKELVPNSNFQLLEKQIVFLSDHAEDSTPVAPSEAHLVSVPFGYTIDPYPVFLNQYQQRSAEVFINANYEVQRITISPYSATIKLEQSIDSLTISEAIANINSSHAAIIGVKYAEFGDPKFEDVVSGKLTAVTIEYRVDVGTQTILPYYHFVGELINAQNQTFTADIITPAIQTNFDQS